MKKRFSTRISCVALSVVGLVVISGCQRPAESARDNSGSGGPIKIAVGIDTTYAPYFVAERQGFFEDAGLQVELVQFGRGSEAVDALAAGEVQFAGSSDATTVTQFQQNKDLRALYVTQQSGDYVKVVYREGVATPADIRNVAIVPGLSEVAMAQYLNSQGINPGSVNFITVTPNDANALLERGDADAFVLWEPWPASAVEAGVGSIVATTGDYDWTYNHWIISSKNIVENRPEDAQAVAAALAKAADLVESDPALAVAATTEHTQVSENDVRKSIDEIDFRIRSFTEKDIDALNTMSAYFESTGVLSARPDFETNVLLDWLE